LVVPNTKNVDSFTQNAQKPILKVAKYKGFKEAVGDNQKYRFKQKIYISGCSEHQKCRFIYAKYPKADAESG
jgi:hypothetical protein